MCVWLAGPSLEDVFGRPLFAVLCLLAIVSSAGAHALAVPDARAPMIGTSGLAAGLLGAFLVRFTRDDIRFAYVFFARGRLVNGTFAAPAWLAVPIWLAAQVFTHFVFGDAQVDTGESLATSVTALGTGAAAAFALLGLRVEDRLAAAAQRPARPAPAPRAADQRLARPGFMATAVLRSARRSRRFLAICIRGGRHESQRSREAADRAYARHAARAARALGRAGAALPARLDNPVLPADRPQYRQAPGRAISALHRRRGDAPGIGRPP